MRESTWWAAQVSTFLHPTKLQWMHNAIERVQLATRSKMHVMHNKIWGWEPLFGSGVLNYACFNSISRKCPGHTSSLIFVSKDEVLARRECQLVKAFAFVPDWLKIFWSQPYLPSLPVCCCSVVNLSPHSLTVTLSIYWSILLFWIENTISTWACLSALSLPTWACQGFLPIRFGSFLIGTRTV